MAGRNPYSRPGQLPAVVVLCFVPVGIVVAVALANPPSTYTGCPAGDPTPIYVLDVTERTSTDLIVLVNATTNEFVPLSVFSAVLSRDGSSVAEIAPLADGTSNGSLSFHDRTRLGNLSKGDRFAVSLSAPGRYRLDVFSPSCEGVFDEYPFGRAEWTE